MFDGVVEELDPGTALAVAADLRATSDLAETWLLQVAAHFGDLHTPDGPGFVVLPGMERAVVYGGEGCPEWPSSPAPNSVSRWGCRRGRRRR